MASISAQDSSATGLRQQISRDQWDILKPIIRHLYITENRPFPEIARIISIEHGFCPTKKQFSSKIKEWGFKKNFNKSERRAILQHLEKSEEGAALELPGRKHNRLKLERWRKELDTDVLYNPGQNEPAAFKAKPVLEFPSGPISSLGPIPSEPSAASDVDLDSLVTEREPGPIVLVQDDEGYTSGPFSRWANVNVRGSPKLTSLFENLSIETLGLPDDIESIVLPAPYIESERPVVKEFITSSELATMCCADNSSNVWGNDQIVSTPFIDGRCNQSVLPSSQRPLSNPFKLPTYDCWFDCGVQFQVSASPYNELYPFPESASGISPKPQISRTAVATQKMLEREYVTKLEKLRQGGIGQTHPASIKLMKNLADMYFYQGKITQAKSLYRVVLSNKQRLSVAPTEDILNTQINLIECINFRGSSEEAIEMQAQTHTIIARIFAPHHNLFRRSLLLRSQILLLLGHYEEEEALYRDLLQINLVNLGPRDPSTLRIIRLLGGMMWRRQRHVESERLLRAALQLDQEYHKNRSFYVSLTLLELARDFIHQKRFDEGVPLSRSVMTRATNFFAHQHKTVTLRNSSLGSALEGQWNLEDTQEIYHNILRLHLYILQEDSLAIPILVSYLPWLINSDQEQRAP